MSEVWLRERPPLILDHAWTPDMSTDTTSDMTLLDPTEIPRERGNPMIGVASFMSGLAGIGAAYVAFTRHDIGVVAQMGVAAAVCGGIALTMARSEH
jgi:hypothetical protein